MVDTCQFDVTPTWSHGASPKCRQHSRVCRHSNNNCLQSGLGHIPQVRVGLTRGVTHLAHERGEMGAKRCSGALQTTQGAHDEGVLAGIRAEFKAKDSPNFLFAGRSDIGINSLTALVADLRPLFF